MAWLLSPVIIKPCPTQKELMVNGSPTNTACMSFLVITLTRSSSRQGTCFLSFPVYQTPSLLQRWLLGSVPCHDLIALRAYSSIVLSYRGFCSVLFQVGLSFPLHKISVTDTMSYSKGCMIQKEQGMKSDQTLFKSCVMLGDLLNHSELEFHHL